MRPGSCLQGRGHGGRLHRGHCTTDRCRAVRRREGATDARTIGLVGRCTSITAVIESQIEFTGQYQSLGASEPVRHAVDRLKPRKTIPPGIAFSGNVDGIELPADPMVGKVFENLLDNTLRHGETVTGIRVTYREDRDGMHVLWGDNGIGVPEREKEKIFECGYGKNTGLGLFLAREILAISNMSIRETGTPGTGTRFEIVVPREGYRFAGGVSPAV